LQSRCHCPERETRSTADAKSLNERFWKSRSAHALLDNRNIVGHTPELHHLVFEVGNRKCGARITIARLADRAGIQ
jgi:hypothetical protein